MPENICGVPAGRSVFHLTSPLIGLPVGLHARNRAGGKLAIPKWVHLSNSDLSSHAIDQLLGIIADPGLKHSLDVLDLVNSF
jgi:hypothetical protein